jgi:hypothetical protein
VPLTGVVTKIRSTRQERRRITYAELVFTLAGRLDAGQKQRFATYAAALKESFVRATPPVVRQRQRLSGPGRHAARSRGHSFNQGA